jgi:hypothetical protein
LPFATAGPRGSCSPGKKSSPLDNICPKSWTHQFTRELLERVPWTANSDDFVFDNQMLAQVIYFGFPIGEVSCPTRYFEEASSINFPRSVKYGLGVVATSVHFFLQKRGWTQCRIFSPQGRGLMPRDYYAEPVPDPAGPVPSPPAASG